MGVKFLQMNAMCSRFAMDLLLSSARKRNADVLVVSEPNKEMCADGTWYADPTRSAALRVFGNRTIIYSRKRCRYAVMADLGKVVVISLYLSPNITMDEFEAGLSRVAEWIVGCRKKVIVTGDFNAKSPLWGGEVLDRRGQLVMDWAASCDLHTLNDGLVPTFERGSYGSYLDLTLISARAIGEAADWHVLERETLSDHRCIYFEYNDGADSNGAPQERPGWRYDPGRRDNLYGALELMISDSCADANELVHSVEEACRVSLRTKRRGKRKEAYWWTEEISNLHRECIRARRRLQRENRRTHGLPEADLQIAYRLARQNLKRAIALSKKNNWNILCRNLDDSPWGDAYCIVMKKFGCPSPVMPSALIRDVVSDLFPVHAPVMYEQFTNVSVEPFNRCELMLAAGKIKPGKSGGPDGIPPDVIKIMAAEYPNVILNVMNRHLEEGVFPRIWKKGRLVLIKKPSRPEGLSSSYRPLCLLNVFGKLLEQLILARLNQGLEDRGGLSDRQYGFRAGKSTVDACGKVMQLIRDARTQQLLPALVLLDVRNAFNSVSWKSVLKRLQTLGIAPYLRRIIQSYLSERAVEIGSDDGPMSFEVSSGVPQGSVLGPTLWNVVYDELLRTRMPDGVEIIAYADDLALFAAGRDEAEVADMVDCAVLAIGRWMSSNGLQIAPEKTEVLLVSGRRVLRPVVFNVLGHRISPSREVKYLGIWFDHRMGFASHIAHTVSKALVVTRAMSRLMANKGGPMSCTRRLLASVTTSVMMYGVPVWAEALETGAADILERVQRQAAIRVCCAYRTISREAVLVIAGILPMRLEGLMRAARYGGHRGRQETATEALESWQQRWTAAGTGGWTRRLIPEIAPWLERRHGQVDFYLTQFLSGHGCFNYYLKRMGVIDDPNCEACGVDETAEHTFFLCPRWAPERAACYDVIGPVTPESVVTTMLRGENEWRAVQVFCRTLLMRKTT